MFINHKDQEERKSQGCRSVSSVNTPLNIESQRTATMTGMDGDEDRSRGSVIRSMSDNPLQRKMRLSCSERHSVISQE